jgi:hypothetical protein
VNGYIVTSVIPELAEADASLLTLTYEFPLHGSQFSIPRFTIPRLAFAYNSSTTQLLNCSTSTSALLFGCSDR